MKEGWKMKKLGEVVVVERGSSPRPIKKFLTTDSDGVNWIKIGDTKNVDRYIYSTRQKITIEGAKKSRFVDVGDFILTNSMSYGKPCIMKTQGYIHDGWFVFRLPEIINSEYFWYLLVSPNLKEQFESLAAGAIVKNISGDLVKKALLPIPPLTEQKQIVTLLDSAFAKIDQAKANIEKNIANAKELFQSKLNEIFSQKGDGWEKKSLGEICEKTKNIKWQDFTKEEFEYIDLSSVSRETLKVTSTTSVNKENAPSRAKKIILEGDVIFATTRPTLRRATIIEDELSGYLCSTGYAVLRPKDNVNSKWIFFFLLTSTFMKRMEKLQRGASYPAVTDSDVKGSKLSVPVKQELEKRNIQIMSELHENANNLVVQFQNKLQNLEELKKSLLQKAFAGELTQLSELGFVG